ncbi:MAG: hypothetical protein C0483_06895 [Pirellula sp.]|nr:hypothetical protein [Pirellula sp.]
MIVAQIATERMELIASQQIVRAEQISVPSRLNERVFGIHRASTTLRERFLQIAQVPLIFGE